MSSADLEYLLSESIEENIEEKQLKRALKLSPDDSFIISNCGNFYYESGYYNEALDYYLRSLSIDENNSEVCFKIAMCFVSQNLFNDAILYLERAMFLDEENPEILTELARLYYKKNMFDKAKNVFLQLIKIQPENAWAQSNLGNIYFYQLDDIENAYEHYALACEINSEYDWGLYNFATVKFLYKEYDEALELYQRACELSLDNDIFKIGLAHTYYKIGLVDQTIAVFEEILQNDENNADILLCLGKIYLYDKKNNFEAKRLIEKAKEIEPKNSELFYYLAKIAFFDFDKKNAIINIDFAIELDEENDKFKALRNRIIEMEEDYGEYNKYDKHKAV